MVTLNIPFLTRRETVELPLTAADLTDFEEGDICRNRHGELCRIEQIGWLDQTSPMPLEAAYGIVRALVQGYELTPDGSGVAGTWQEWTLVDELELAERRGTRRFRYFDKRYFESKAPAFASA